MEIDERTVARSMAVRPDVADVGWFAARQPGIVGYLEARCGPGSDALGVALDIAWRLCEAFHRVIGVPPARVGRADLERAQREVVADAAMPGTSLGARQPELFRWLADELADPVCPLVSGDRARVGTALAAVIYAVDAVVTGR
jgi:hypothetical protein